ncbi:MAG: hypothetical protein ACRYHA_04325 [Janthinobacterium lividum]
MSPEKAKFLSKQRRRRVRSATPGDGTGRLAGVVLAGSAVPASGAQIGAVGHSAFADREQRNVVAIECNSEASLKSLPTPVLLFGKSYHFTKGSGIDGGAGGVIYQ